MLAASSSAVLTEPRQPVAHVVGADLQQWSGLRRCHQTDLAAQFLQPNATLAPAESFQQTQLAQARRERRCVRIAQHKILRGTNIVGTASGVTQSGSRTQSGLRRALGANTAFLRSVKRRSRVRYARCRPYAAESPPGPLSSVNSCQCRVESSASDSDAAAYLAA